MAIIILMGPPGAGKGTQASATASAYNIPHISTGDIFRNLIKDQTEIGKLAQSYIDQGNLVPDEVTSEIVKERISQADCANGFLLDGYPRTTPQAIYLDKLLRETNRNLTCVINIAVDDEELVRRLTGRSFCPNCGKTYNQAFVPTKVEGICDVCGSKLAKRPDDEETTVRNRLKVYMDNTYPLIKYYSESHRLIEVNGVGAVDEIKNRIVTEVDKLL